MNNKKITALKDLIRHIEHIREYEHVIYDLFGAYPDGGSYAAVEEMAEAYTKLVADVIGSSLESLEWFLYENDFGAKGLEAGIDGDMRKISTVEDYLWLISSERFE